MNRQLSVLLGLCLIADCLLGQQQILNNGDFEKGMMCYSTAVWSTTGQPFQGDYSFLLSTDSHSGSNSLEIRCTGADCFKAAIISDRIQTPPSQAYKLKLHTKCPAGRSAAVYIPDTLGGDTFQYVTCNDAWSPNEIAFTSGAAATDLLLFVYNRDVEWLRIDDMVLTYADGSVPQQPVLHPGSRNVTTSGQTLLVDGAPYFARGFFDVSYQDLPKVAALGANTLNGLQMNMSASCFNTARMDYLDRAYELGLNFMPDSSSTARLKTPGIFPNVVNRFGPHLANIGWFLADEPDQAGIAPWYIPGAMLVSEYQAIKSASLLPVMADFQRPTWSSIDETRPYVGSTDIWMAEPYGSEFFRIDNAVNIFNQLRMQPIWIAEDTDAALILPKAYWAVIKGVSGIVYYNWPGFKDDAPRLNAVSQVFTELKQLNDVIFAPSAPVTPPAGIGAVGRLWNGVTHVLAANAAATTVQGTFAVPSLAAGTPVTVLFENRVITAQAGGFTDTFSGASRHVYSFRMGSPTTPVTLASTPSGLTLTVDNASCVTPCNYNWAPGSSHTIAAPATAPGTSGTRSSFSAWSDSGALSHSITVPSTALTLTASYLTQYYLTTSANPVGGGGITPAGGWFNSGAAVSVAAAPGNGYQFFGFSGALSGAVSPQTLTLAGPAAVTANYTAVSQSGWYDVFANRRKITIDHTRISGALANFPLLVSLANPELKSISNGGKVSDPGGNDIVFTAADGTTRLNHELESYNPSSGSIAAWVQVPSVNPSTDIPIYIYYGKAGAAAQQKPASVWDSGYRVVNHFKDTGASDSTQYLNSAVANAGATLTPAGVVGSAYSVDGVAGQLSIPYSASWNGAFSSYTVELWIKPGGLRDYAGAVSAGGWGSPFNIWFYRDGFATLELDTTSGYCATSGSIPLDNAFHHVALTYDAAKSQLNAYIDGVGRPYPTVCSGTVVMPQTALTIGRFANGSGVQAVFDELRISAGVPRSQAWLTTTFNNQKSPASFYSVGAAEQNPGSSPAVTTITSLPTGLRLSVDAVDCIAPCTFSWTSGTHTITAPSPQTDPSGAQFVFSSWSDGGGQSHVIIVTGAAAFYTANFHSATPSNWYGAWSARQKITVDHTKISGALANFPILISLSNPQLKSAPAGKVAKADGSDIVFTAADGLTRLSHEIESYDAAAGTLVAWVRLPSMDAITDTSLFLYYGNAAAPLPNSRTDVWDSGYRVINHFKDTGASDSTQYLNSAVANAGATLTPAGVIGSAYSVDGVSGQLSIPYSASWNGAFSSYTVELWIKPGSLRDYAGAVSAGGWGSPFNIWFYRDGFATLELDTTSGYCATSGSIPLDNAFHHVALTYDAAKSQLNAYIDGVGRPYPTACSGTVAMPQNALTIGRFANGSGVQAVFDELRVSAGVPRSQAWLATAFNNQKSPASFYAVGAAEIR